MDAARTAKKKRTSTDEAAGAEQSAVAREAPLLRVQRLAGNRAASALTGVARADQHESAETVVRRAALDAKGDPSGPEGGEVDADTAQRVASASGGGTALDHDMRASVEAVTGASLGDVRLHDNNESSALAEKFGAAAFTVGRDIFFGSHAGAPDSPERQGVLAHELGHTVQDSGDAQRMVARRLLIDDADRAFKTAVAANPGWDARRKLVDDNVSAPDQKKLSKLHGILHNSKKETDQDRALADAIRAVVLSEYAQRLESLKANDKLTDKDKAKKRAIYIKKADEYREKVAPLAKKGPAAPETRVFLEEFALDTVAAPTKQQQAKQMSKGPRLDVRSTFIGGPVLGMRLRAHLFLVYTTREGKQLYFRGGPTEDDFTTADWGDYTADTIDYDPSAPSVTVLEGDAASAKLDALIAATNIIDGMKVPYRAQIGTEYGGAKPNALQKAASEASELLSTDGENCNATAWTILTRAGIKPAKPMGRHPGWGSILGSKTKGKENALPAPEVDDPSKKRKYRFAPDRDEFTKRGMVQIYHDRNLTERQTIVAADTEVELLEERTYSRKVLVQGKVGFVARSEQEIGRHDLRRLADRIRAVEGVDMKGMAKAPIDAPHPHTVQLAQAWELEEAELAAAAREDQKGTGTKVHERLAEKLEIYGVDKLKKVLQEPVEIDEIVRDTGARQDQVLDAIVSFIGKLEVNEKIALGLGKQMEIPQQLYFFASDVPNFTVLKQVAKEAGTDINTVMEFVRSMLPSGVQPLLDLISTMKKPALRKIADGKDPAKAQKLADGARVPIEFVVKRVGEYVGPAKKKKVVEPPKKVQAPTRGPVGEDDKKLKLFIDIPANAMYENAPQWTATALGQIVSVERTDGAWAYVKTSLDYFPVWARADDLERFKEAHGQPLPKQEEVEDEKPKEPTKQVDDPKRMRMFADMPNSPADYARPNAWATTPSQIVEIVEDGPHWISLKTTLDDWPFWVKTADLHLFADAHGVEIDKDDEVDDEPKKDDNVKQENIPALVVYEEAEEGAKKWGDVHDPSEVIVVTENDDWCEVTFKFDGSFMWVKRGELEEWEKKHGRKARR